MSHAGLPDARGGGDAGRREDGGRWYLRDVLTAVGLIIGTLAVCLLAGIVVAELARAAGWLEPLTSGEAGGGWGWRAGRRAQA
ncbi:MAG: hypothetical protein HYX57_05885 [Chloroflexi bacterium]|nr:hypothetical protein [Chloroflexota bacterium]